MLTIEEAKAMEGTEFTYIDPDGDTIQAYVKKFDPEVGLTCYSLSDKTDRDGWSPIVPVESDGTFCCIAMDFKNTPIEQALFDLCEIRDTGSFNLGTRRNPGLGHPVCSFQ